MANLAFYFYFYLHIVGIHAAFETNTRTFKRHYDKKNLAEIASTKHGFTHISCAVECINNRQCTGANFRDSDCAIFEEPENTTLDLSDDYGSIGDVPISRLKNLSLAIRQSHTTSTTID